MFSTVVGFPMKYEVINNWHISDCPFLTFEIYLEWLVSQK